LFQASSFIFYLLQVYLFYVLILQGFNKNQVLIILFVSSFNKILLACIIFKF